MSDFKPMLLATASFSCPGTEAVPNVSFFVICESAALSGSLLIPLGMKMSKFQKDL